jgi:hypothetical protein
MRARVFIVSVAVVLATGPGAWAKFRITLSYAPSKPAIGQAVRVVVRAAGPQDKDCRMRLAAVAPAAGVYDVLAAENQLVSTSARRLGFFVPLARAGPATWRAVVRFPRGGRWRLVVPNWCAPGYALPPPIVRPITVRSR